MTTMFGPALCVSYFVQAVTLAIILNLLPCTNSASYFHRHYFPDDAELFRAATLKNNFNIDMTVRETSFLMNGINKSEGFLEFGSSGLSILACVLLQPFPSKSHVIIDSTANYAMQHVKDHKCIKRALQHTPTTTLELIDIGKVDPTGFPTTAKYQKAWPLYSNKIGQFKGRNIDTIFLDGKFRVASLASALLVFPHCNIYLHDYKRYETSIDDIGDMLQHCDSMFRIKRKEKVTDAYLKKKIAAFASDPN